MAFGNQRGYAARDAAGGLTQIDLGLREHMLKVYNYMATGLAVTGLVALLVASSGAAMDLVFNTPLRWVAIFAPFALVLFLGFRIHSMRASTAQSVFWLYAALMGVSMASIFAVYTHASIARVFFITAGTFAGMSLYGYTTKRDLSGFGSFLVMGLWGIVLAGLVNMFLGSSTLGFVISAAGVLIFTGLTAYDTQKIKQMYFEADDRETSGKKAIIGALELYLDFINLFLMLMRLLGDRR